MSSRPPTRRQTKPEGAKGDEEGEMEPEHHVSTIPAGAPQNHIYVGKKPVMSYAMSALIQLSQAGEVVVKARGLAISRAVDVAEIVTKRLGNGVFSIKNISINTEQVKSTETGEMRNVSSIEIVVGK
ncbi:MAG: DNA-binding protein Alba [Thaumarchaeota archaeon]|nr:DNA-binding protein Alba [Nitrososphaerota archaeon]